jgi:ribokinase
VGSDQWGEKLLTTLQKEGVNTDSATIVEHETSSFSIILSLASGERSILYAPGVNEHLQDATFDVEAIGNVDAVYLNHLSDASCMIEDNIIDAILAEPRMHLSWNPGGCQIKEGMHAPHKSNLLKITSLLLLNKEEALTFSQSTTMEEALKKLSNAGVKVVCITDGKNGTTATDGKNVIHCPILPNVKVVDTTGAGDAFGTGATWALVTGKTLPEALIAGTLNAASVVEHLGAQAGLLTETQITNRMKNFPVSVSTRPL